MRQMASMRVAAGVGAAAEWLFDLARRLNKIRSQPTLPSVSSDDEIHAKFSAEQKKQKQKRTQQIKTKNNRRDIRFVILFFKGGSGGNFDQETIPYVVWSCQSVLTKTHRDMFPCDCWTSEWIYDPRKQPSNCSSEGRCCTHGPWSSRVGFPSALLVSNRWPPSVRPPKLQRHSYQLKDGSFLS